MKIDNRTFLIIPYLSHKFCSDFGIGGDVVGTTPVFNSFRRDFIEYIGTSNEGRIPPSLHHSTDELTLHQRYKDYDGFHSNEIDNFLTLHF